MTTKQKVFSLAQSLNCTVDVDDDGEEFTVNVNAPDGFNWEGPHSMVESQYRGPWGTKELWKEVLHRMTTTTLQKCEADCDCKE